jgi:uncharacterized protein (AIM24 family)
MHIPVLIPTKIEHQNHGSLSYHIIGELVPMLQLDLGSEKVYFEHHVLLWKEPSVAIGLRPLKGGFKRMMAGLPIFLTEASGPGQIAFSRDGTGQVFPVNLTAGQAIDVREHQFLAATGDVEYSFSRVKGVANLFFGGSGFWLDRFQAGSNGGVVWLNGYGNVSMISLAAGEQIDMEPGAWIFKDPSVAMETQFQRLSTGFFASAGQLCWNRFTGPGRVAIQSMYIHMPTEQ